MNAIDLKEYAMFEVPTLNVKKVYNTRKDYEVINEFNKAMVEIHREYSIKEKLSFLSAKNVIIRD